MTVITEGDLQITLPDDAIARKFDDNKSHCLSHCMKAVDFVVDHGDERFFIEFKDPQNPRSHLRDSKKFKEEFLSGKIDNDLKIKYRDSFLYEWGLEKVSKPIFYLVLIGADWLDDAELLARTEALQRQLPVQGPGGKPWKRNFVEGCAVMNVAAWNRNLPKFPASRLSV
ncbi:MAG: hypothetical protein ACYDEV_02955 [Acidiferrobacter sp.]